MALLTLPDAVWAAVVAGITVLVINCLTWLREGRAARRLRKASGRVLREDLYAVQTRLLERLDGKPLAGFGELLHDKADLVHIAGGVKDFDRWAAVMKARRQAIAQLEHLERIDTVKVGEPDKASDEELAQLFTTIEYARAVLCTRIERATFVPHREAERIAATYQTTSPELPA